VNKLEANILHQATEIDMMASSIRESLDMVEGDSQDTDFFKQARAMSVDIAGNAKQIITELEKMKEKRKKE